MQNVRVRVRWNFDQNAHVGAMCVQVCVRATLKSVITDTLPEHTLGTEMFGVIDHFT